MEFSQFCKIWTVANLFTLSVFILIFGFAFFVIISRCIIGGMDPEKILRTFGVILIIIMAMILVLAGHSAKDQGPIVALLSTIAGYLLSKMGNKQSKMSTPLQNDSTEKPSK